MAKHTELRRKFYSKSAVVAGDVALRVVIGVLFAIAGFGKLFGGVLGFGNALEAMGFPIAGVLAIIVAVIEFAGGICSNGMGKPYHW